MPRKRAAASVEKLESRMEENIDFVADEGKVSTTRKPKRAKKAEAEKVVPVNEKEENSTVENIPLLKKSMSQMDGDSESHARFIGAPVPAQEAKLRWPERYQGQKKKVAGSKTSSNGDDCEETIQARHHFLKAEVDERVYVLHDDAHVKAGEGQDHFICKIIELFESIDGTPYFTAQWYYRGQDTVISDAYSLDKKRVFFSEIQDVNPLECLVEKIKIVRLSLNEESHIKEAAVQECNYYCNMLYLLPYSTYEKLPQENSGSGSEASSTISTDDENGDGQVDCGKSNVTLLDLYSGCGGMSTGLCLGANMSNLNLVTKWAIDVNPYACESLKLNHPETEVRNESVEDFLTLLKEWEKLCIRFSLIVSNVPEKVKPYPFDMEESDEDGEDECSNDGGGKSDEEIFEVEKILAVCYGDPKKKKEPGLYFKVHWKGYGEDEDSWEPIEGLGNCRERIEKFVRNGFESKILPLPGHVDMICGGPPCQGVSGFNRFRNKDDPLADEKNKQLDVFMNVVGYLKPKFVLMENVVDLVKFSHGFLGRYALGRLIDNNYQVRMGMMAAGAYGLPQFRMRVFVWGACATEKLPQYPLPTHDVVMRGVIPTEFEMNTVAYDEGCTPQLERKLLLEDAISDLPSVENNEHRDEIPYGEDPKTEFQRFIRLRKHELFGSLHEIEPSEMLLYDHRPLELNSDDYQRVCRIPKKKGANFRDLPGVCLGSDKKVFFDPEIERVYLDSGKPLVPSYAMSFVRGTSSKPFARLWWDETVPTVVTRAEPHNQKIVHPEQDRVLTIRENARLQGFPDYYKLCGPIKERYIQVGNAVAVPVARALGYALGQRFVSDKGPLFTLPPKFPNIDRIIQASSEDDA
ncbi:Chromomethylase 1 putative isoform 3 [Tripterygium wilfordii]|uniref:DNA (cytosine-5-)-methyltransferase n=1 Tax=Tripterygium wilfordii TaxID=458696 RepID=A0A7J7CNR7_TRIWF|nr:DNA (cytosine-5)-methyltransferase CMT3-like [Tripterygium wilfordii]KAF5735727.1 Chromomethylase 1 putative isoform 3 [Tripterygium wilfordii]